MNIDCYPWLILHKIVIHLIKRMHLLVQEHVEQQYYWVYRFFAKLLLIVTVNIITAVTVINNYCFKIKTKSRSVNVSLSVSFTSVWAKKQTNNNEYQSFKTLSCTSGNPCFLCSKFLNTRHWNTISRKCYIAPVCQFKIAKQWLKAVP